MMKRSRTEPSDTPIEEHDSGFSGPMAMFGTFPHNDTFVDNRVIEVRAKPDDNSTSETYTFLHHRQEYGILNLEDAVISAKITVKLANGNATAGGLNVALNPRPLTQFWKSKTVWVNNEQINTVTTQENELAYIRHLLDEVPSSYNPSAPINLCIHNTPGQFDDITTLHDPGDNATVNRGAAARWLACNQGDTNPLWCYDIIDITGDHKRFVPTSFDIRIKLDRLEKNKCLLGTAADCATAFIHYNDLKITIPAMKPRQQLTTAINQLMIQQGAECRYYIRQYRYVPSAIRAGTNKITLNDIFTGARPTRMITYVRTQVRYNGSHILSPNRIILPNFTFFGVKINEAWVTPVLQGGREAYLDLRRILNRRNEEMPFTYKDFCTDYGILVTDLTENKDSYNRVLPNTTSGIVGLEMRLGVDLVADSQIINVGEFRNQLSIGYQSAARSKYDF
jgi:hypothetical protein